MLELPKETRPDFFIVGTMKGGTTILYDFICSHPSVARAKAKEIHYFSLYPEKGLDWYLSHFDFTQGKITGEASPSYFDVAYTAAIPKWIKALNPEAKIILITRDPVERAVSHFYHLKNINKVPLLEDMEPDDFFSRSFHDALKQKDLIDYYLQQVLYFSSYSRKFSYYKGIFGDENILVLDNGQLRERPKETMQRVFSFLKIAHIEEGDFGRVKYSSGKDSSSLSPKIKEKLSDFLYDDYHVYCRESGLFLDSAMSHEAYIEGDVLIGKDGWLFLSGGSNSPLDYYLNKIEFNAQLIRGWCDLLESRREKLSGYKYIHLFVPNKETIYDHKIGGECVLVPGNPLGVLFRHLSQEQSELLADVAINPVSYFRKIRDDYQLYWKTDSHWSPAGCFAAYQLVCAKLGIKPRDDLLRRPFVEGALAMDLGSKLTDKREETVRFYNFCKDSFRAEENELVKFKEENNLENEPGLHVGSHVKFVNPSALYKQKVIIFGDSFSECRPSLLTGMLAETFYETHFIWSTALDYDFISEVSPDIIISEIAERFMPVVPRDDFHVRHFPGQRLREFKKSL